MEWCIAVGSTGMGIKTRSTQSSRQRINMSGQRYMHILCVYMSHPRYTYKYMTLCNVCIKLIIILCTLDLHSIINLLWKLVQCHVFQYKSHKWNRCHDNYDSFAMV